jgi:hypothetical protein
MFKVTIHPHCKKDDEHIFLMNDGKYVMELTEKDMMLALVAAKEGGIYLDVGKEIYRQAIDDALHVISGCSESGSYDYVEALLDT